MDVEVEDRDLADAVPDLRVARADRHIAEKAEAAGDRRCCVVAGRADGGEGVVDLPGDDGIDGGHDGAGRAKGCLGATRAHQRVAVDHRELIAFRRSGIRLVVAFVQPLLFLFVLGTGLGIVSAWRRGSKLDSIVPPTFVITSAIPYFWVGMVLVLIFALSLHWFPSQNGYYVTTDTPGPSLVFFEDVFNHAVLPAVSLLITTIGTWILTMRNTMITTLAEDYVRMARAKGLPGRRIMFDYAARNAILPNLTGFGLALGGVVGGSILVEQVFGYPGIGFLLFNAVIGQDYPLMQALFLLITVSVLVANFLVDILYGVLDPRTRR